MDTKNTSGRKKYVLYVDCDYATDSSGRKAHTYITKSLRKKYSLDVYENLDEGVIDLVRKGLSSKRFSAIVTHVPYGRLSNPSDNLRYFRETVETQGAYGRSLNILRQIKMIDDIPIIAYTGAGDSPAVIGIFMEQGGINRIVHKSIDKI